MANDRDPNSYYHGKLGVEFYDLFNREVAENGPVKGDVAFYVEKARACGGPVLELATGTGRVLWPIARAGIDITGIDASEAMLAQARAKAANETAETRSRAHLHRMDMTAFNFDQTFRLALVPFRSFQHLDRPEMQRAALECVHRSLVPRGELVIDMFDPRLEHCVPGAASPNPERRATDPATGHTIVRRVVERINDPIRQLVTEAYLLEELDADGEVLRSEENSWTLRWATRQEMRYLFELTGFEVAAEYSDFFGSTEPLYGKEQLWVLRKV